MLIIMHSSLLWLVSLPFSMMSIVLELYARGQGSKAGKNSNHPCYKQLIMYMYVNLDEKKTFKINDVNLFYRTKLGGNQSESILISQLQNGVALEFERSDPPRRLRLLLSELLFVSSQVSHWSKHNHHIVTLFLTIIALSPQWITLPPLRQNIGSIKPIKFSAFSLILCHNWEIQVSLL